MSISRSYNEGKHQFLATVRCMKPVARTQYLRWVLRVWFQYTFKSKQLVTVLRAALPRNGVSIPGRGKRYPVWFHGLWRWYRRLSRNVGKNVPLIAAWWRRREQFSRDLQLSDMLKPTLGPTSILHDGNRGFFPRGKTALARWHLMALGYILHKKYFVALLSFLLPLVSLHGGPTPAIHAS